jgi:hypothetical protein
MVTYVSDQVAEFFSRSDMAADERVELPQEICWSR